MKHFLRWTLISLLLVVAAGATATAARQAPASQGERVFNTRGVCATSRQPPQGRYPP